MKTEMKNKEPKSAGPPAVERISRRCFLRLAGAGGAVAALAPALRCAAEEAPAGGAAKAPAGAVRLPEAPSQNPAFRAAPLADGGLAVWTRARGEFLGYRLNPAGRWVWRRCDGRRSAERIGAMFGKEFTRPGAEAVAFLEKLRKNGVVVCGGFVVPGKGFPKPPPGGAYNLRIEPGEPLTPNRKG
jgi:hypothetical protein